MKMSDSDRVALMVDDLVSGGDPNRDAFLDEMARELREHLSDRDRVLAFLKKKAQIFPQYAHTISDIAVWG